MRTLPKTRILVTRFPYSSQMGGEELHSLALMEKLDQNGFGVFFMGSCDILLREFEARHFEVQRAWLGKPPVSLFTLIGFTLLAPLLWMKAGLMLRRARRRWGVDTVYMHSFGEKLLMTGWALGMGMKVVWVEHARVGRWFFKNPWRWVYQRLAQREGVSIVVTSYAMRKILLPWVPRVMAIPCGVISVPPGPLPEHVERFMKGGLSVVCVARLTLDKGVDMLVQLVQSKPEIRLILVGEGPLLSRLQCSASENVLFVPKLERSELMSLYEQADVVVLPSRKMDPFGMVAAEAMSMGTPVLVTKVCGIAQDLRQGEHAWIVEPTVREMDKGLKRLMKDPALRQHLGQRGKAFALKHYHLETEVEAFMDLLTKR